MEFICWCNLNQGFLSFLLSCCTIIISIVALVISIINGILKNKKKLNIYAMVLIDGAKEDNIRIHIVNCGYKVLGIEFMRVMYKNIYVTPSEKNNNKTLMPAESVDQYYSIDQRYIKNIGYKEANKKFNISVIDSYGKKYKCKKIYLAI